jgi:hypothetical protein
VADAVGRAEGLDDAVEGIAGDDLALVLLL